jgi:hypothetical protein
MPLTDAELDFLSAYVHEVYTPSMTGPHAQSVIEMGATQTDLSWLLTAYHRKAQALGRSPLGTHSPKLLPIPWSSREQVLSRGQELREELEHPDKSARTSIANAP